MQFFPHLVDEREITREQRIEFMTDLQKWGIMVNGTPAQQEQARQWFKEHYIGIADGSVCFRIEPEQVEKVEKTEKAKAEDILAFNELFKHYIHLAEGGDLGLKEVCEWIANRFWCKDIQTREMLYIAIKGHERFDGFALSVAKMNEWHPFTLAFEAHRIGKDGLISAMNQPGMNHQYNAYMRLVAMFLILCRQYKVVMRFMQNCVFYTVQKGDTMDVIASKFNTSIGKLLELNQLQAADRIYAGQKLRVVI